MEKKIPVFISYAHEDDTALNELLVQLVDNKNLDIWVDRQIVPGQEWNKEIRNSLNNADLILFLVSEHFMGSEYIRKVEIESARQRAACTKIGIIISPVVMSDYPFNKFQALPKNATAISTYPDRRVAWLEVSIGIQKVITYLLSSYQEIANEGTDKSVQTTDKLVMAFVMLLAVMGLGVLFYGLINQSSFYIATAFVSICLGLGGYFFARKYKMA